MADGSRQRFNPHAKIVSALSPGRARQSCAGHAFDPRKGGNRRPRKAIGMSARPSRKRWLSGSGRREGSVGRFSASFLCSAGPGGDLGREHVLEGLGLAGQHHDDFRQPDAAVDDAAGHGIEFIGTQRADVILKGSSWSFSRSRVISAVPGLSRHRDATLPQDVPPCCDRTHSPAIDVIRITIS